MKLTEQQAKQSLTKIHARYMSFEPDYIDFVLGAFDALASVGLDIQYLYSDSVELILAVAHEGSVDPTYGSGKIPGDYINDLASAEFVDFVLPGSLNRSEIIEAIESGTISKTQLGGAMGFITKTNPSLNDIFTAIETVTGQPVSSELPEAALSFPGLNDEQVDSLVSIYIAAFNRAPDYEGLKFWAGVMSSTLNQGQNQREAFFAIGNHMYEAGERNGEGGTSLSHELYVSFAYNNALGRAPDADGYTFWVSALKAGTVERGDFLTAFLDGVVPGLRDDMFLEARVAVASHAAQEHISGPSAPGSNNAFLQSVLEGVTDATSARTKISQIINDYGTAPTQQFKMMLASWANEVPSDHLSYGTPADDSITLVGISNVSTGETVGIF
ncbi:DUF4214 domain-containing protein [Stutzerimonas stutzeri]